MTKVILQGDCLEKMAELEANSIDTIITDPPYGLSFMGKKWDYDVPSIEVWKECLRVLKPGGTALIFAGSRTQHRMAVNVEDAGFELKDCIMWLYGSGFPKATDISKQLDKNYKGEREIVGESKGKGFSSQQAKNQEHGFRPYEKGLPHEHADKNIYAPATEEAKLWNGWKSHGLKPAYEPILVAQKPNDGTYANNALKWGVSGLNIDGGRIPATAEDMGDWDRFKGHQPQSGDFQKVSVNKDKPNNNDRADNGVNTQGRFPANIILDEEAAEMLDEQTGDLGKSSGGRIGNKGSALNMCGNEHKAGDPGFGDTGGASRFFYVAKASKSERNAGLEDFPIREKDTRSDTAKGSMTERGQQPMQNFHPTVKPLKLMEYLCTLTKTPTGGVCLDPFAGSGTTGLACQNTGRDYILIEREEEYIPIIEARLKSVEQKLL